MNSELIEFLDRQFAFLCRQQGIGFLRQLRHWCFTLQQNPRVESLVRELAQEGIELIKYHLRWDDEAVQALVSLRQQLVICAPEIDDSEMVYSEEVFPEWNSSLAYFDKIAIREAQDKRHAVDPNGTDDTTRTKELLRILGAKLEILRKAIQAEHSTTINNAIASQIESISERRWKISLQHEHRHREFTNNKLTSGGISLLKILNFIQDMNPPPRIDASLKEHMNDIIADLFSGKAVLYEGLYNNKRESKEQGSLDRLENDFRSAADRAHEELRLRVGARRSLLSLLHRFRARCEWHDRDRLYELVEQSRTPEDDLAAELAKWFFDQGFCPITKPLTGRLQPDLLEPSRIYVEAKQYKGSARSYLKKGAYQLHDTAMRLKGTPYEVREAFYVVFRLGGPRYVLPESVTGEGWTVFPLLVDIAPTSESGSRQSYQPREITEQEMRAAMSGIGIDAENLSEEEC